MASAKDELKEMDIIESTAAYEKLLRERCQVRERDLDLKHQKMAQSFFEFFRSTYYRWAELWPEMCPELSAAPKAVSVCDLHVENFGTWRDIEGRLIWGVNDFDEAYPVAYVNDLVRLAASAVIAIEEPMLPLALKPKRACVTILEGYRAALKANGVPFVLAEKHVWLRDIATSDLRDPKRFWKRIEQLSPAEGQLPPGAEDALNTGMPAGAEIQKISPRIAGLGSLGRPRYVALANYKGGYLAREVKSWLPSACGGTDDNSYYGEVVGKAIRCPDPTLGVREGWIVRRLAPYCSRIELSDLPEGHDERRLLKAMGFETANIHLGTLPAATIAEHLGTLPGRWLFDAARQMLRVLESDWREWRLKA